MGHRTVKRVPLEFTHPLNEIWAGYVNPHYRKCLTCTDGGGWAPGIRGLQEILRRLLQLGEQPHQGRVHPYLTDLGADAQGTPLLVDFITRLVGEPPREPFGYTSTTAYSLMRKLGEQVGMPEDWFTCPTCKGSGEDPATRALSEAWGTTEPPTGPGWQLWETVSEGSPISPVFDTPDGLARWCVEGATIFASERMPFDRWLHLIVGEDSMEAGSLFVSDGQGYVGSLAQAPDTIPDAGAVPEQGP